MFSLLRRVIVVSRTFGEVIQLLNVFMNSVHSHTQSAQLDIRLVNRHSCSSRFGISGSAPKTKTAPAKYGLFWHDICYRAIILHNFI